MAINHLHTKILSSAATFTIDRTEPYTFYEFVVDQDAEVIIENSRILDFFILVFTISGTYEVTHNGILLPTNPNGLNWVEVLNRGNHYTFLPSVSAVDTGNVLAPLDAITGLSATTISSTEISLSFTDPNAAIYESGIAIYRSETNDVNAAILIDTIAAGSTSYDDSGLTPETTYYYWVKALGNGITRSDAPFSVGANATTDSAAGLEYVVYNDQQNLVDTAHLITCTSNLTWGNNYGVMNNKQFPNSGVCWYLCSVDESGGGGTATYDAIIGLKTTTPRQSYTNFSASLVVYGGSGTVELYQGGSQVAGTPTTEWRTYYKTLAIRINADNSIEGLASNNWDGTDAGLLTATWVNIGNYTYARSSILYPCCDGNDNSVIGMRILNPQAKGLV